MTVLWQDLVHSVRSLRRRPGFTLTSMATLALGIGATSAVFSVVSAVLLRPFPYEDPDNLVIVWERNQAMNLPYMYASPPNYVDWREGNSVFHELGAFQQTRFFLEQEGEASLVHGARITSDIFPLLGVNPLVGGAWGEDNDRPGSDPVVVLSYQIWRNRFGGDPGIVGRTVLLSERSHRVIGVMPAGFAFPPPIIEEGIAQVTDVDIWVPLALDSEADARGAHNLSVIGRLRDGVDVERARAEMQTLARRLEEQYPSTNAGWDIAVVPLAEQVVGNARAQLLTLLGAVAFVLLIACVNVANLLLARGTTRLREFAVRASLGAGRRRLIRQALTESLTLAVLGGIGGLLVAFATIRVLVGLAPRNIPRLEGVSLDAGVVGFTLLVTLLTGLLFGLAPALQSLSRDLGRRLREGGRTGSEGRGAARLRSALVVSEVALSLVLLVGAGLLLRSFVQLRGVDAGFQTTDRVTMQITLPRSRYPENTHRVAAYTQLERQLNASSAIQAAGFISDIPLAADRGGTEFLREGESEPPADEERIINISSVTPTYFSAIGVRLLRGRYFSAGDAAVAEPVVIINEAFARRHFRDSDPTSHRLGIHGEWRRIVGVVGDVRHTTLRDDPRPAAYLPYYQWSFRRSMSLVVLGAAGSDAAFVAAREAIRQFDPGVPIHDVKTMDRILGDSLARMRFSAFLITVVSAFALLLAAVGIYGVIAYSVSRRTQEIGVRVAIGAQAGDILSLVLAQGMRTVLVGVLIGLAVSLGVTRLLGSLLFGVGASDPATIAGVVAVLAFVALAASYLPARRASRVNPVEALRHE